MRELVYAIFVLFILAICLFGTIATFSAISYFNFDAYETIHIDRVEVYSGMGRHTRWYQMGEVGNNYVVREYRKGFWNKFFGKVIKITSGKELTVLSS